ncbi:MYND-type zinc finger protein samB [Abortiporus biennis]
MTQTAANGRILRSGSHLKDTTTFPPFFSCPGEVKDIWPMIVRLMVDVEDIEGRKCRVAMHIQDRGMSFMQKKNLVKAGHTIAVLYPMSHQFMDFSEGFRIEDPSNVMFIRSSLKELFDADTKVRSPLPAKCCADNCDKDEDLQACSGCRITRYCGKEHQAAHWGAHKAECKAISALSWFHNKDWTRFQNRQWFSFPPP